MINVGRIVNSRNFAQPQGFIIHRKPGHWVSGRWISLPEQTLNVQGTVQNASPKEMNQVPEADRITGMMRFHSQSPMYVTRAWGVPGTSDELEWKGDRYRVVTVNDYSDYGYYEAFAVYMEGV